MEDPMKNWIASLMDHGGYFLLLGTPAVAAMPAFLGRIVWLRKRSVRHPFGRTNTIYWPTQLFILLSCLSLCNFLRVTLQDSHASFNGLVPSAICLVVTEVVALFLNHDEHWYRVRSSDSLFLYFMAAIFTTTLSLLVLVEDADPNHSIQTVMRCFTIHLVTIVLALVFEAAPRDQTQVQRMAKEKQQLGDYELANLFSRLTYHFFQRIVSLGASRPLVPKDLENTTPENLFTDVNYQRVSSAWQNRLLRGQKSGHLGRNDFFWSVLHAYRWKIVEVMATRQVGFTLIYAPPMLLSQLLRFIGNYYHATQDGVEPPPIKSGLMIAFAMFFCSVLSLTFLSITFQGNTDLGIQMRAAVVAMVYRKSLRLSPKSRQQCTLGEITNHMAVDAERWIMGSLYLPHLISSPFEIVFGICLLYRILGWSMIAGLGIVAIVMPIQARMAGFLNGFQSEKLKMMDSRLRLTTEVLANIKIVKLYAWEDAFRKMIDQLRSKELMAQKNLATVRALLSIVFSSVTLLMALGTFTVYSTVGGPGMTPGVMSSEVIFVSITLFSLMNRPLGLITPIISSTIAVLVANRRLQKFMLMEEVDPSVVQRGSRDYAPAIASGGSLALEIEDGTFAWDQSPVDFSADDQDSDRQHLLDNDFTSARPTLDNISLKIRHGSLTAVVGRVGQGKSSLLSVVMGEMYKWKGHVRVFGELAYVPQQPWILNATVKDNILFGKEFDQELYSRVVHAAGLEPDIDMLPAGDQTEIGERGINLSGGQKQRVSLARAAYQDADIYLLDDPLSAVDAHVDHHLWENLIGPNGLLKDKTRVLVTHGIHHLDQVDQTVVIKHGTISESGLYQDLIASNGAFHQLIKSFSSKRRNSRQRTFSTGNIVIGELNEDSPTELGSESDPDSERDTIQEEDIAMQGGQEEAVVKKDAKKASGALVGDEKMVLGKIGPDVVMIYARAASLRNAAFCLLLYFAAQGSAISTNLWLRRWITDTDPRNGEEREPHAVSYYLAGYAALVLLCMVVDVCVNYMSEVVCGITAARVLYDRLLTRVLHLPMSFFDTQPMGRVVNRFSSDVNAVDEDLPLQFSNTFRYFAAIVGTLLIVAYSTPAFLIAIPPFMLLFYLIQSYFIKASGSLKRMMSVAKSPLFQHFSESLAGVSTLRATRGLEARFIKENVNRNDVIVNRMNAISLDKRWLQIRLEALGAFMVLLAALLAVLNAGKLDPSLVGLALSYSINMTNYVNFVVRTASEVQNLLVSVERIDEYSHKPVESPLETSIPVKVSWPDQGKVVFKGYSTRYREGLDLVLKDVSFEVLPGEKVGIVGRTGAGKSSLTLALFRLVEAADSYWAKASDPSAEEQVIDPGLFLDATNGGCCDGGSIEIDGVDISKLSLKQLRQHLAIIPQDPTLFSGTVRDNLDPFQERDDTELWTALERAHLKDYISLEGGLDYVVSQGGDNFSVGQRSLMCLARALLKKTKVLVLDEATAAVDVETDELIQQTIRKEFKDRTILTIAHRIKTVMDSDKILVLEKGKVEEFASPEALLKRPESLFFKLAVQAGAV